MRATFVLISIYLYCVSGLINEKQNTAENDAVAPISDLELEKKVSGKRVKFVLNSEKWPFLQDSKIDEVPIEKDETVNAVTERYKRQVKGYPQHYQNYGVNSPQQPYGGFNNTFNSQPVYPSNNYWNPNSINRTSSGYPAPSYNPGFNRYNGSNPQHNPKKNFGAAPRPGQFNQYPQQNYYGVNQTTGFHPSQRPYSQNGYLGNNTYQQHQGFSSNNTKYFGQFNNTRYSNNTGINPAFLSQRPPYINNGSFNHQNINNNPTPNPYQPYNNTNFGTPSSNSFPTFPGRRPQPGTNSYPPKIYPSPYGQNSNPSYPQTQGQNGQNFSPSFPQPNPQGPPYQGFAGNNQYGNQNGLNQNSYGNGNGIGHGNEHPNFNNYPTKGGQGNGSPNLNQFYNPSQRNDARDPTKVSPHEFNSF